MLLAGGRILILDRLRLGDRRRRTEMSRRV